MRNFLFLVSLSILIVTGVVFADTPQVTITSDDKYLYIKSNGIPFHEHGTFPNEHNPNVISAQDYNFRVPLHPQMAVKMTPVERRQLFGVAVDGVPFDPGTAEFFNNDHSSGWNYDALSGAVNLGMDDNNAHVQPNGAYHYHGIPTALASGSKEHSPLIGYAADGFPVYALNGYAKSGSFGLLLNLKKATVRLGRAAVTTEVLCRTMSIMRARAILISVTDETG
jgi:hypothetical protein